MVEVVSRQFAVASPEPAADLGWQALLPERYGHLVDLGVFGALTLAVLFLGVRPAVRRLLTIAKPPGPEAAATAVVMGADGKPLLVHGATGATIGVDRAGNPVVVREPIMLAAPTAAAGGSTALTAVPPELVELRTSAARFTPNCFGTSRRRSTATRTRRSRSCAPGCTEGRRA